MKILYVGYPIERYGAPHQSMAAIYLAHRSLHVDFICWGGDDSEPMQELYGINYSPKPKKSWASALAFLVHILRRIVFRNEYDLVYVQGAQQTPFLCWLPLVKGKKRVVYHTQDYLEPGRHVFYERFERWFSRHSDYVICNEPNRGRFMKSHYGLRHMPVVVRTALPGWWGIPERNERLREKILREAGVAGRQDAVVIVAGGAYRPDRMSPQLLEAFSQLPENYCLVFNGPVMEPGHASRKACEQHMQLLGVHSRVVFFGALSFDELLELCCVGDLGVLLYPNDGIGHYYQCPGRFSEYLRCGLTLVSSNFMGLELLILKYGLGAVCDVADPASIAAALLQAGREASKRRERILATAFEEFIYEKGAGVLDAIVEGSYQPPEPPVHT